MNATFDPYSLSRPHASLLKYYLIISLLLGPFSVIVILPLFFKYETLRYRFDEEGVAMSWGILFRREIYLTYRRIQDIHLTRNILQRWMGLATVSVQTASGSSSPEMAIEGILEADALRDFLYQKMRGARDSHGMSTPSSPAEAEGQAAGTVGARPGQDEAVLLLREIRDALRDVARQRGPLS